MSQNTKNRSGYKPSTSSSPCGAILLTGVAVVALAYWGFVRPAQQHMLSLERQCGKLAIAVKKLQSKDDTARHGLRLIGLLEAQNDKLAAAEDALDRFDNLRQRVIEEANEVTVAITALEQLETVQSEVVRYSKTLTSAAATLNEMAEVATAITASSDTARLAKGSLAQLGEQQVDLASGIAQLSQQLSSLEIAVTDRSENLPQAEQVLAQIDQLCAKMSSEVEDLSTAQTQLSQLAGLKEEVLAQALDVPAASTVLEEVWDLKAGLIQSASTIDQARRLAVDMMLLDPVFERVAKSLLPITEATRLSRREAAHPPKTRQTATVIESASPWSNALNVFVALLGSNK